MQLSRQIKRPPLRHYGGKWRLAPWIIDKFPPHDFYLEPFAGGLSVLLRKPPAKTEIVSDLNPETINFWLILRDHPSELISEIMKITPHREIMRELTFQGEGVISAANLYWRSQMSFSGVGMRWNSGTSNERLEVVKAVHQKGFDHLREASRRLQNVIILQMDGIELLDLYSGSCAVVYCDPPYLPQTRMGKGSKKRKPRRQYLIEQPEDFHESLIALLQGSRYEWFLSGYPSRMYEQIGTPDLKHATTSDRLPTTEALWKRGA